MPPRIFISVDLPAPFSPMRASTSPGRTRRLTFSSARTPGKDLLTPSTSRIGGISLRSLELLDLAVEPLDVFPVDDPVRNEHAVPVVRRQHCPGLAVLQSLEDVVELLAACQGYQNLDRLVAELV